MSFELKRRKKYLKITSEMFQLLVAGKEVIIGMENGPELHFILEDMGWYNMQKAIVEAFNAQKKEEQKKGAWV